MSAKYPSDGFTLLELLLTITIIVSMIGLTLPLGRGALLRQNIRSTADTVVGALVDARARARAGVDDDMWGVHLENGLARVFAGNDYSTRDIAQDRDYDLPSSISIDAAGEIFFSNQYAQPSGDLSYVYTSDNGGGSRTITVNQYGVISVQ